eukprot:scaffold102664_cov32-Tisochrysis_lutea.AAC.2
MSRHGATKAAAARAASGAPGGSSASAEASLCLTWGKSIRSPGAGSRGAHGRSHSNSRSEGRGAHSLTSLNSLGKICPAIISPRTVDGKSGRQVPRSSVAAKTSRADHSFASADRIGGRMTVKMSAPKELFAADDSVVPVIGPESARSHRMKSCTASVGCESGRHPAMRARKIGMATDTAASCKAYSSHSLGCARRNASHSAAHSERATSTPSSSGAGSAAAPFAEMLAIRRRRRIMAARSTHRDKAARTSSRDSSRAIVCLAADSWASNLSVY